MEDIFPELCPKQNGGDAAGYQFYPFVWECEQNMRPPTKWT